MSWQRLAAFGAVAVGILALVAWSLQRPSTAVEKPSEAAPGAPVSERPTEVVLPERGRAVRLPEAVERPDPVPDPALQALTTTEQVVLEAVSDAALLGVFRVCAGGWAVENDLWDDRLTVTARTVETEQGLIEVEVTPPTDAPSSVAGCMEDGLLDLAWPTYDRPVRLERQLVLTAEPGRGEGSLDEVAASIATEADNARSLAALP